MTKEGFNNNMEIKETFYRFGKGAIQEIQHTIQTGLLEETDITPVLKDLWFEHQKGDHVLDVKSKNSEVRGHPLHLSKQAVEAVARAVQFSFMTRTNLFDLLGQMVFKNGFLGELNPTAEYEGWFNQMIKDRLVQASTLSTSKPPATSTSETLVS